MARQITFYLYEVGIRELVPVEGVEDTFKLVNRPVTTAEAASMPKSEQRRAILEAGVECPRGTETYAAKVGRVRYTFETADLLAIAKSREELPLD